MKQSTSDRPMSYVRRVRHLVASSPKTDRLFFSGYVTRSAGAAVAVYLERTRVTPNLVSIAGLVVHAIAALLLVVAESPISVGAWLAVLLLWQLAFSLDAADGQLARLRGLSSAFGAWLDTFIDVATHVMVYGALTNFLVRALDLDGTTAATVASVVLGAHLLQLFTGWRHEIVRSDPAVPAPPPWLALGMRARHLIDYGWFLLVAAILLPQPRLLLAFLLASSAIHVLAAVTQLMLNWYREMTDRRPTSKSSVKDG